MNKSWGLEDTQKFVNKFPRRYSKPSKEAIEPLEKGHKAKLIFTFRSNDPDAPDTEELWVEVLLVQGDKLLGQLEDAPKFIQDLKCGEIIEFEENNIIETD